LLTQTDHLLLMVRRRVADLWRVAAAGVDAKLADWAPLYQELLGELGLLASDAELSSDALREQLAALLQAHGARRPRSRAENVRDRLIEGVRPVRALLKALVALPWRARASGSSWPAPIRAVTPPRLAFTPTCAIAGGFPMRNRSCSCSIARRHLPVGKEVSGTAGKPLADRLRLGVIGVIVFWVTHLVLIVDFKLLWCFGLLIHLSYGRLVFSLVLVITVIIVFGTCSRRGRNALGLVNIGHKNSS
jgi:hypothetical protein